MDKAKLKIVGAPQAIPQGIQPLQRGERGLLSTPLDSELALDRRHGQRRGDQLLSKENPPAYRHVQAVLQESLGLDPGGLREPARCTRRCG